MPNRFEKKLSKRFAIAAIWVVFLSFALIIPGISSAKVTGTCANCHTMHNSQGGSEMATYGADGKPWKTDTEQPALLRGTCLGCHGQGLGKIENEIPQVYHADSTDLAGGNFKYIDANDNRGHNVFMDLGNLENTLGRAPGNLHDFPLDEFTCAGASGCHGYRKHGGVSGIAAIKGAHHQNTDGLCDTADTVANSYRFLYKVKGFENMGANKYENLDASNHNEYFGATSPALPTYTSCTSCHNMGDGMSLLTPGNTISGFCGTCHGQFHAVTGIGGTSSPFIRHPTDIVLKVSGEYAAYTTYSVEAPIGRTTVPSSMSSVVTPGTDVVTCLSCHAAHATEYPDMLRWSYDAMNAGGGGSDTGCFTCHTQKNDPT